MEYLVYSRDFVFCSMYPEVKDAEATAPVQVQAPSLQPPAQAPPAAVDVPAAAEGKKPEPPGDEVPIEERETQPGMPVETLTPAFAEPVGLALEAAETVAPTVLESTNTPAKSEALSAAPGPSPAPSKVEQNSNALNGVVQPPVVPPDRTLELRGMQALADQHVALQLQQAEKEPMPTKATKIDWTTHKKEGMRLKRLMEESAEGAKFPHMQSMFSGSKEATRLKLAYFIFKVFVSKSLLQNCLLEFFDLAKNTFA